MSLFYKITNVVYRDKLIIPEDMKKKIAAVGVSITLDKIEN